MAWGKTQKRIDKDSTRIHYSAKDAANALLVLAQASDTEVSNMKLQKLVYIAYGYYLAITGDRLFADKIEAWDFGPVIPSLYHELKKYGARKVTDPIPADSEIEEGTAEMKILENVWLSYKKFNALQLSEMTHKEGTPWSNVWKETQKHTVIPDHLIRTHYQHLLRNGN
jgi:uncharacterized phage-associated protein